MGPWYEAMLSLVNILIRIGAVSTVHSQPRVLAQLIMSAIGMVLGFMTLALAPEITAKLAPFFIRPLVR
jgi:hypothetical protein